MSNRPKFQLRWRGRTTGPYSLEEIMHMLGEHEIGLWHEIGNDDGWSTLGEFLEKTQRESALRAQGSSQLQVRSGQAPDSDLQSETLGSPTLHDKGQAHPVVIHLPLNSTPAGARVVATIPQPRAMEGRNRKVFVVLGLLMGFTGAHNFYAGYWGTAVVQIVLSGVTWALGFGIIISWLWALIELVVVHSDAHGRFMK